MVKYADYSQGKIYKIVGENGATYYGSTTMSLRRRTTGHRSDKKTTAYQMIISKMDCKMILIENYPCESKKELETREAWYIRGNPCVNRLIPGRTYRERYQDNRERYRGYEKKYYENNREEIRENKKVYRATHLEKILKYGIGRERWVRSFGDPRNHNCLQRCDPSLFQ
tara:strand:+ start:117 stop:623 length:507 start_codon:yes stop_codon:yes gene_type:complete